MTWEAFPHDPERYRGKGLPAWVEKMMVEGAVIDMEVKLEAEDVEQYAWASGEGLVEAILETDRHLTIGALEYVPDAEIKSVLEGQVVHPILKCNIVMRADASEETLRATFYYVLITVCACVHETRNRTADGA